MCGREGYCRALNLILKNVRSLVGRSGCLEGNIQMYTYPDEGEVYLTVLPRGHVVNRNNCSAVLSV